jgi:hypothetical protein
MSDDKTPVEQLQHDDRVREYQGEKEWNTGEKEAVDAVEPWLPIETKLVIGSLVCGVIALVVLAIIVHIFILGGLQ